MKTLLLVRHAKSSWNDPTSSDHARPLNERGREAAPRAGRHLLDSGLVPDGILSSTAERARATAEAMAEACGYNGEIVLRDDLYLASAQTLAEVVRQVGGDHGRLMLVAHNPGVAEFVERAAGAVEPITTANVAHFEWDIEDWSQLQLDGSATLVEIWRPREAD